MNRIETAMAAAMRSAERGFRVFPLRKMGTYAELKRPAINGWQEFATSDVGIIHARWSGPWRGHNHGVATGRGLLVLDFDVAKGGLRTLDAMELDSGSLGGLRVRTPTGGMHVYQTVPAGLEFPSLVEPFEELPGMDIRCAGGYVVGPGSVLSIGDYAEDGGTLVPVSSWLH